MRTKVSTWLKRYLPAEITAILFSYIGYFVAKLWFDELPVLAYASSLTETLSFYAVIVIREYNAHKITPGSHSALTFAYTRIPKLILEFGPAECLDSLIFRPLLIGFSVYYVGPLGGILAGKLLSDVLFYVPVILTYEMNCYFDRKKQTK